jgi:hypothetical protein
MRFLCGRRSRGDEGLSLAELVVTMFLGSLVLSVLGTSFAVSRGATSGISARTTNTMQERTALNALTKNLRAAVAPDAASATPPFCYAQPSAVLFYTNTAPGNPATLVKYSVDASKNLIEQQQPAPTATTWAPCSTTTFAITRTLANNVAISPGIFTFNTTPTVASPNGAPLPFVGSPAALSLADTSRVDTITISLDVQTPSSPTVPATTVITQVRLPNSKY